MRILLSIVYFIILIEFPLSSASSAERLTSGWASNSLNILPADDFKTEFERARSLINDNQYQEALTVLLKLIKIEPDNCNLNFLVGYCYYYLEPERIKALPYLEKAVKSTVSDYDDNSSKEKSAPVYAFFYLGKVYHWTGRLEAALTNLEKFRGFLVNKSDKLINQKNFDIFNEVNAGIEQVKNAQKLVASPLKVEFVKIPLINAGNYSCYGAQLTQDGNSLYYSREKINDKIRGKSDLYVLKKQGQNWVKNEQAGLNLNGPYNDVFNSISSDGKFLLFSSDRKGVFNVFYSMHENNKWSEPFDNLSINSNYNESYATLSADGNKMFFVSDRPGGFGGKDIYKIEKKSDGSWSQPENLGFTINTAKDEDTPWLSEDGNRLYFSSAGHNTMGGADIFYSEFKGNIWREPVNMGYPVNSVANDLYFKYYPQNNLALLSSNRKTGGINYEVLALRYIDSTRVNEPFKVDKEAVAEETGLQQQQKPSTEPLLVQMTKDTTKQKKITEQAVKPAEKQVKDLSGATQLSEKEKKARQDSVVKVRQKLVSDSLTAIRMASIKKEIKSQDQNVGIKAKIAQDSIAKARETERKQALARATQEKLKKLKEKAREDSIVQAKVRQDSLKIASARLAAKQKFEQGQQLAEQAKTDTSREVVVVKTEPKTVEEAITRERRITDSLTLAGNKMDSLNKAIAMETAKLKSEQERMQAAKEKSAGDSIKLVQIRQKEKAINDSILQVQVRQKVKTSTDSLLVVQLKEKEKARIDSLLIVQRKEQEKARTDSLNALAQIREPVKETAGQVVQLEKPRMDSAVIAEQMNKPEPAPEEKPTQAVIKPSKEKLPDTTRVIAVIEKPVKKEKSVITEKSVKIQQPSAEKLPPAQTVVADTGKLYTVQVGAGWMKIKYFKSIDQKKICYGPDGLARFIVGSFKTRKEAEEVAEQMRLLGFTDAWVARVNEKRCVCPDNELMVQAKVIDKPAQDVATASDKRYTVQVGAGNMKVRYFRSLQQVRACTGKDGLTRFIFGDFSSKNDAILVKDKIVKMGFLDAWTPPIDENRCGGQ